jgi:hypothetical protein
MNVLAFNVAESMIGAVARPAGINMAIGFIPAVLSDYGVSF